MFFDRKILAAAALASGCLVAGGASAASINVAVAANFTAPSKEIVAAFKAETGDDVVLSFGSSGALISQIEQGAPFAIFLSADATRPEKLEKEKIGVAGTRFTYAIGKLALWSAKAGFVTGASTLKGASFSKIAIADPAGAPYGAAAIETMQSLGLYDQLKPKIVEGANIAQTFQFVNSGNAELGFVALSQLAKVETGSRWVVPQKDYTPIRQDAVLLKSAASDKEARAFLAFLKGPEAAKIIRKFGYGMAGKE